MRPRLKAVPPFALMTASLLLSGLPFFLGCTPKTRPLPEYKVTATFETGLTNVVRAVHSDGPVLWVGTTSGILKIDRRTGDHIRTFAKKDGMSSDYVFSVNVDPNGSPWFGTDAGGLLRLDGEAWTVYGPEDGLADPWVYDIDFHPDGSMWVATWDGVSRYDPAAPEGARFTTYTVDDGLVNKWVYGLAVDRDESLWFGTEEGANRFDPKAPKGAQWKTYSHKDGLGAPNELALARKQTIGEAFETLQKDSGIELAPGRSYAGHFHDLGVLDEEGQETYNENYIFSIAIDSRGDKWFGTWGGGVSRFDGKTWTNYTVKDGLSGNIVFALEKDPSGYIWAGTNHGLSVFDGSTWNSYTIDNGLISENVYAIAHDPDGNVWIGQRGGVVQLAAQPAGSVEKS